MGIVYTNTDGRGNTTTTKTDIAGRTVSVTDAAGNTTTTAYSPYFDQPSVVTNALGNTTCYSYDLRGRKTAQYGSATQPVLFGYDEADRMVSLTTFREDAATSPPIPRDARTETSPPGATMKPPGWFCAKPMRTAPMRIRLTTP